MLKNLEVPEIRDLNTERFSYLKLPIWVQKNLEVESNKSLKAAFKE